MYFSLLNNNDIVAASSMIILVTLMIESIFYIINFCANAPVIKVNIFIYKKPKSLVTLLDYLRVNSEYVNLF